MTVTDPSGARATIPRSAWVVLAVASAGYVLVGFNSTATNLAFSDIAGTFSDSSESTVSWVVSSYFIGTAAFLPLGGRLADRYGRRRVFLGGEALFALSALLSAVAPSLALLVAARVLQAVAGALVIPSSLALVLPEFPESRRATAVSTWAAAGPLSAAIAPSTAAVVLGTSGWRVLYLLTAPIAAVVLFVGWRTLKESSAAASGARLDWLGAAMGTSLVALVVLAISEGPEWGWTSGGVLGLAAASVALVPLFVWRCNSQTEPLMNLDLFRIHEVWLANLANFLVSITSLAVWLVWPIYLARIWDYSKVEIGLAITAGPIGAGPAALAAGRLAERFGSRWLFTGGTLITALSIGWAALALGPEPDYWRAMFPSIFGFGVGWGLSSPVLNSWALDKVESRFWGEANATFNTLRNVAAALGVAAAVAIIGSPDRPDLQAAFDRVMLAFLLPLAAAFVVLVVLHPRQRPGGSAAAGRA